MRLSACSVLLVSLATLACNGGGAVDLEAVREELMQADRDFAVETAKRGADGWADWFEAEGVMFPPSGKVKGREAIRERMQAAFAPGNPGLVWEPETAVVSASGDLGYTTGRWQSVASEPDRAGEVLATGYYVSIWRRNAEGEWRVALDIGNSDADETEEADTPG